MGKRETSIFSFSHDVFSSSHTKKSVSFILSSANAFEILSFGDEFKKKVALGNTVGEGNVLYANCFICHNVPYLITDSL